MVDATILEQTLARTFAAFEQAAANGERAPGNGTFGIRWDNVRMLALRGDIRVEISGYNYRTVKILRGPHAGKQTKPAASGRLWKIIDHNGSRRLHPDGSVNIRSLSRVPHEIPTVQARCVAQSG